MSRKKFVDQEYMQGDVPAPAENQEIAMSLGTRGGNTLEVQFEDGSSTLCLIPSKFMKKLWIRKGGLVMVEKTVLEDTTAKVTGTIVHVLYDDQLKSLRKQGVRIPEFGQEAAPQPCSSSGKEEHEEGQHGGSDEDSDSDDSLSDIPANLNRVHIQHYSDEDSS